MSDRGGEVGELVSIVIPVLNEEGILPQLYDRLTAVMQGVGTGYEVLFVNDGSTDGSLAIMQELHERDPRVKVISLSRNFGHQVAITAGLDFAKGDAVIVMDGDLQDPPEVLPRMLERWRAGYDVVYGVRKARKGESWFKRLSAAVFYRLMRQTTSLAVPVDSGDFRLLDRRAADSLRRIRERSRYVRGLTSWIGFRQTGVTFERDVRRIGTTKYPLRKMLKFALDGITAFSTVPLQLATYLGFVFSAVSFAYIVYAVYLKLFTDAPIQGWASLVVAVLFLGGIQLTTLGIVGAYVGRIYEEVKDRPLYVVDSLLGLENGTATMCRDPVSAEKE